MASFGRYIQITLQIKTFHKDIASYEIVNYFGSPVSLGGDSRVDTEERELSSDLKTEFVIESDGNGWKGKISVFNLAEESRQFPYKTGDGGSGRLLSAPVSSFHLKVDAGYEDDHAQIFECSVAEINEYKSGTDLVTEYIIGSVPSEIERANVSLAMDYREVNGVFDTYSILMNAIDQNPLIKIDNGLEEAWDSYNYSSRERNVFCCSCSLAKFLKDYLPEISKIVKEPVLLTPAPFYEKPAWFVGTVQKPDTLPRWGVADVWKIAKYYVNELGVLCLYWEDELPKRTVFKIDYETGIIGVPRNKSRKKDKKLKIRHILIPKLRKRTVVDIKLSGKYEKLVDGKYQVDQIKFVGSNYGGKHEAILELGKYRPVVAKEKEYMELEA